VPEDVVFKTKPQIALDRIKAARAEGVPEGVVLADAADAHGPDLCRRRSVVGAALASWSGQGRPPTLMRRDAQNQPQSAGQLAKSLPADAWRDVAWREGVDKTLHSRFAVLRMRPAHRDYWRSQPYP
jgi:SRSO17 transposase